MADGLRVVLADFHRGWGGQAAYVLTLARGLAAEGNSVTVACPPGSELEGRAAGAGLEVFTACGFRRGFRPLSFWKDVRAMKRLLAEQKAQVVHTHGSQDCWRAALCARPRGCRHVRTKHNSYAVSGHPANRWLYRRGVDRLVVVAGALKPLLEGILPPERIEVLHAPVSDAFFDPPGGEALRAELGIGPEVPLVGVIARLVPDKGQADVVRALVELRARFPEVVAVFAGDGSEYDRLVEMSRDLGVAESARFLGPRADVPAITAALDVAVLASTGCDASSTVVKEALAAGCPVVATEVGGIREILCDGQSSFGSVVPPGEPARLAEAIGETLAGRDAARARATAGREAMRRKFSEKAFVAGQLEIYRSVLSGGDR
jgi:glycosyltransferase involved in cell wall biosynthesis